MRTYQPETASLHSDAWIFQVKASFAIAVGSMAVGIAYLPVIPWMRAFLAIGLLFVINATLTLAKTLRDVHESRRLVNRIDEAKVERILVEHDPFRMAS